MENIYGIHEKEFDSDELQEIRRKKLKSIINQYYLTTTALSEKVGINRANLSAILTGSRKFTKSISNRLEIILSLPSGYLSEPDDVAFSYDSYFDVVYYDNLNDVNDYFRANKFKLPKKLFNVKNITNSEEFLIVKIPDDLMAKTINKNEFIVVDGNQVAIEDGSIYLYEYLDAVKARRFQIVGKDKFQITFDNDSIKSNPLTLNLSDVNVMGKVICVLKDL